MRSKKTKERESYVLRMCDGTLVEVTRAVYLEWHRSKRREKYQYECRQKHNVCYYADMDAISDLCVQDTDCLEDTAIGNICIEKLYEALRKLSEPDAFFIYLMYFEELPIKEIARICKCDRRTIHYRRDRILKKLRLTLQNGGLNTFDTKQVI